MSEKHLETNVDINDDLPTPSGKLKTTVYFETVFRTKIMSDTILPCMENQNKDRKYININLSPS